MAQTEVMLCLLHHMVGPMTPTYCNSYCRDVVENLAKLFTFKLQSVNLGLIFHI